MTVSIVTDLGYGDSGKGTTVDYLARQGSAVVVRHNGGPQAGHNVVTADGRHHEFSQFGSGTFAGAKTFLSRFMLINPLNMFREADHLISLGIDPWKSTWVDKDATIVTPWHVAVNRMQEIARGADRHGSCGQGVGVTQMLSSVAITAADCRGGKRILSAKLDGLRQYLMGHTLYLKETAGDLWTIMEDDTLADHLADRYMEWHRALKEVVPTLHLMDLADYYDHVIFEGAQGVLLDEWYGFHPFTTWSTTTHQNALTLVDELHMPEPVRYGVTRAYMTRHGAGPFVTEDSAVNHAEPHNVTGDWQGGFRQGHLDLVALRYAVDVCGGVDQLVVTHLDRTDTWKYCDRYLDPEALVAHISPLTMKTEKTDLAHQELLARVCEEVEPGYVAQVDTGMLLDALSDRLDAPVGIFSRGPTAEDKHVRVPA